MAPAPARCLKPTAESRKLYMVSSAALVVARPEQRHLHPSNAGKFSGAFSVQS